MRISDWGSNVFSSIRLFPMSRLKRTAVPKARTDEVMQAIIADFARPRRHRLDALAIPRTDQARDIGRAHPLPSLVAKALQIGRQPTLQINKIGRASCRERVCQYV